MKFSTIIFATTFCLMAGAMEVEILSPNSEENTEQISQNDSKTKVLNVSDSQKSETSVYIDKRKKKFRHIQYVSPNTENFSVRKHTTRR